MAGLTAEVADFVANVGLDAIGDEVRSAAGASIVDGLGLAVAGARSAPGTLAASYVADTVGRRDDAGTARAVGTGERLAPRFAAFVNGVRIHADDFDDTQLAVAPDRVYGLLTHPTAPVLAAVAALAEARDADLGTLLTAYLAGVEVATKVAEAIEPRHYQDGFHSTGTAGAIGAAAGAARLLGLDAETTAVAVSIGASQAAGLRENFGTMTKPLHAGRAAESGVVAAELARRGWTAAPTILEADRGFFRAAGGGYDEAAIRGRLGAPWTVVDPGLSIKPYPSGSLTHPAMCAMADLVARHDVHAEDIVSIYVGTNRHMPTALIHHRPRTDLQAKFSMEYCLAVVALVGAPGLAHFTDEFVLRDDVQALLRRVNFAVDPDADRSGYHSMDSIVRVELADGRTLTDRRGFGLGSPQYPMSPAQLLAKFADNLAWGGVADAARRNAASRALVEFDLAMPVRKLVDLLAVDTPVAARVAGPG